MSEYCGLNQFPYVGNRALHFEPSNLHDHLLRHRDHFRSLIPDIVLNPFLDNRHDSVALRAVVTSILELIRAALDDGQFVCYARHPLDPRDGVDERLLILDRYGTSWYFREDRNRPGDYRFQAGFYRGHSNRVNRHLREADALTRAIVYYRQRLVGHQRHDHDDGLWTDFRFGWAEFWKPTWQPTICQPHCNPLKQR